MTVADIGGARKRRDRISAIADWIITHIPWTVEVMDWPGLGRRWPALTSADLESVEVELKRRADGICADGIALESVAARLKGRRARWSAAADWFFRGYPDADMNDPEFTALFGDLTRAEVILAAIEYRRLLALAGSKRN